MAVMRIMLDGATVASGSSERRWDAKRNSEICETTLFRNNLPSTPPVYMVHNVTRWCEGTRCVVCLDTMHWCTITELMSRPRLDIFTYSFIVLGMSDRRAKLTKKRMCHQQ